MTEAFLFLVSCACVVYAYHKGFNDGLEDAREGVEEMAKVVMALYEMNAKKSEIELGMNGTAITDPKNKVN